MEEETMIYINYENYKLKHLLLHTSFILFSLVCCFGSNNASAETFSIRATGEIRHIFGPNTNNLAIGDPVTFYLSFETDDASLDDQDSFSTIYIFPSKFPTATKMQVQVGDLAWQSPIDDGAIIKAIISNNRDTGDGLFSDSFGVFMTYPSLEYRAQYNGAEIQVLIGSTKDFAPSLVNSENLPRSLAELDVSNINQGATVIVVFPSNDSFFRVDLDLNSFEDVPLPPDIIPPGTTVLTRDIVVDLDEIGVVDQTWGFSEIISPSQIDFEPVNLGVGDKVKFNINFSENQQLVISKNDSRDFPNSFGAIFNFFNEQDSEITQVAVQQNNFTLKSLEGDLVYSYENQIWGCNSERDCAHGLEANLSDEPVVITGFSIEFEIFLIRPTSPPLSITLKAFDRLQFTAPKLEILNATPYLEFSPIPDGGIGNPIDVQLTAKLSNGDLDTSFTDCIELSTNNPTLTTSLTELCLLNGVVNSVITISGPGADDAVLEAKNINNIEYYGYSNQFSITNPLVLPTSLAVDVKYSDDLASRPFVGTVFLETPSGEIREQATRNIIDLFSFDFLSPGRYKLWAVDETGMWRSPKDNEVIISAEQNAPKFHATRVDVSNVGKPPVLILPGMMGSTTSGIGRFDTGATPFLPSHTARANELRILNGVPVPQVIAGAGFNLLRNELIDAGYNVILVPWDWRKTLDTKSLDNAIDLYLRPALRNAKDPNGDGVIDFPKVDVVAHSMGGLLVRSYIQSSWYDEDIRRFAMVGTPNQGSLNSYPMIQGAAPQQADGLGGSCRFLTFYANPFCFYSRATDMLYRSMNDGESPFKQTLLRGSDYSKVLSREELFDFYALRVPTGRQLEATTKTIKYLGDFTPRELTKRPNTFLTELNSMAERNRLSSVSEACADDDRIGTKLFATNIEDTLSEILVRPPTESHKLYPDGFPMLFQHDKLGDGTVLFFSALTIPGVDTDSLRGDFGKHLSLVGKFRTQIRDFLTDRCVK
jgi:pimeloyl-ACP methyl ester carboxylesterase